MGVIIYPLEIGPKVERLNQNLQKLDESAAIQESRLTEVSFDIGAILKGCAWNTVRDYVCSVQLPLMKTYRLWIEEQKDANDAYKKAAYELPRVSVLDEDQLEDQLDYWERRLSREESREEPSRSVIRRCKSMIGEIRTKLRAIRKFVSVTNNIYDRPDHVLDILGKTRETLNGVSYDPQERSIQFDQISNSWLLELQNAKDNLPEKVDDQYIDRVPVTIEEYLFLLLSDGGRKEAVNLIRKGELDDKAYEALAIALLETEDKGMLGEVLNACYQYEAMVGPIQEGGGITTENNIYVGNGELEKLVKHMEQISQAVVSEYAELSLENREVMGKMFLNAMQYEALLKEMKGMGDSLVVSRRQSVFLNDVFTKPESGRPISVTYGEEGTIQISWCEVEKGDERLPFEKQKLKSITVSKPTMGSGAWAMVEKEGFQYIKSELGLGFGMDDATGIAVDGVFGVKGLWSAPTSIGTLISGVIGDIYGGFHEEKVYDKGVNIAEQGSVLHLFNLYCVSNVVDKGGNEVRRSYSVYPSYQEKDSNQISTEECIENFNRNLSAGGKLKDAVQDMGFQPYVSTEILLSEEGFEKTKSMLEKWNHYAKINGLKVDDVTANLPVKGK